MKTPPEKPPELCRFRSFAATYKDGKDEPEVYDLLRGRVRFSDVRDYNDPFEARPHLVMAHADDPQKQKWAMLQYLEGLARLFGERDPKGWAVRRIAGKSNQQILDEIVATHEDQGPHDKVRLLCLSELEAAATPLPWSHYADSHRGVCIHFDTSKCIFRFCYPVVYSVDYPTMAVPRDEDRDKWKLVEVQLLTKCRDWSYEREWRVIRSMLTPDRPAASLHVQWERETAIADPMAVKALTLGARMPGPVRDRLTAWTREHARHVEVWQARLHASKFVVQRDRVA